VNSVALLLLFVIALRGAVLPVHHYTAVHFHNALESMVRVESVSQAKGEIVLTLRQDICGRLGSPFQLRVRGASESQISVDEILLMGFLSVVDKNGRHRPLEAIRKVSASEWAADCRRH
jgi:hypothetical protein